MQAIVDHHHHNVDPKVASKVRFQEPNGEQNPSLIQDESREDLVQDSGDKPSTEDKDDQNEKTKLLETSSGDNKENAEKAKDNAEKAKDNETESENKKNEGSTAKKAPIVP